MFAHSDIEDFEDEKEGVIRTEDVRKAMKAQGIPPRDAAELREFLEILDPDSIGYVTYANFVAVCALKLNSRSEDAKAEEVEQAYRLFTKGGEGPITISHLRRVARELREEVSDEMLRNMIVEANGGAPVGRGVGVEEFEGVMRRAGVF
jgi:Ca2+-binding EF-hand superfamily protein